MMIRALVLAVVSAGCAAGGGPLLAVALRPAASAMPPVAKPSTPAAAAAPLQQGELGRVDTELLSRVAGTRYIDHLKVGLSADGGLRKFSIYHNDPDPIPPVVRQVLRDKFPRHRILNYETEWEREDGAITEVAIRLPDQRTCELSCLNDGTIRYIECLIEVTTLPAEVLDTVRRTLPGASVVEAGIRSDEAGDSYKVSARDGKQLHALMLSPQGELTHHRLKIPAVILVEY